jgi:hypothetical protein
MVHLTNCQLPCTSNFPTHGNTIQHSTRTGRSMLLGLKRP